MLCFHNDLYILKGWCSEKNGADKELSCNVLLGKIKVN